MCWWRWAQNLYRSNSTCIIDKPMLLIWQLIPCTHTFNGRLWNVYHGMYFTLSLCQCLRLKYIEQLPTDSMAKIYEILLCCCIDMSKFEWSVDRKIAPSIHSVCHHFVWLRRHANARQFAFSICIHLWSAVGVEHCLCISTCNVTAINLSLTCAQCVRFHTASTQWFWFLLLCTFFMCTCTHTRTLH